MARVTNQVLIDTLTKQGIALTGNESLDDLKKLNSATPASSLGQAAAVTPTPSALQNPEAPTAGPSSTGNAAPAPATSTKTEVTVKYRDHQGKPTERTFSKEVHGNNFAALADELKETNKAPLITE